MTTLSYPANYDELYDQVEDFVIEQLLNRLNGVSGLKVRQYDVSNSLEFDEEDLIFVIHHSDPSFKEDDLSFMKEKEFWADFYEYYDVCYEVGCYVREFDVRGEIVKRSFVKIK